MKRHIKILISGGGTGGHIFPAIAIAHAIKKLHPSAGILFIGARGRMEMKKVPEAGFPIKGLWISGFSRKLRLSSLIFPIKLACSLIKASWHIIRFRPDVAVGTGGYASGPSLKAASLKGIPVLLQEQNSFPGITNRLLAKKASTICVAYDNMESFFPGASIIKTGNPVRKELENIKVNKKEAREYFGFDKEALTILVIGGSQGALSINKAVEKHLDEFTTKSYQILWQCGSMYYEKAKKAAAPMGKQVIVKEFIKEMDMAYACADMVVSRAGAIAISELAIAGKAVIFIPLPTAAADHQKKNAMALAEKNAAVLVDDTDAYEELNKAIDSIATDREGRERLEESIKAFAFKDAADRIALEVIKLINKKA